MASLYKIPKEIKGDNKIAFNMNKRQLISCMAALSVDIFIYLIFRLELEDMLMATLILSCIALFVSTKTVDGMSIEMYAISIVKIIVYHSNRRTYRTKNKVITSLNSRYSKLRNADLSNSKTKVIVKKREKRQRYKRTKIKAIY